MVHRVSPRVDQSVEDTPHVRPVPSLPEDTLDEVAARYAYRRPEEVTAYLREYPHLVPLLLEAADRVPRYFGPDAPLVLEVVADPEADKLLPELFALIRTTLPTREALDQLDRFDADWWTMASPDGPGVVVVDIERG